MVVLKTIFLKGTINEALTYPLPLIENIRVGEWQMALSSVSLKYFTQSQHPNPIKRVSLKISSNYIMGKDVNEQNEIISKPATISAIQFGGNYGQSSTIGFKNRDFFTINNPEPNLRISFKTVDTEEFVTGAHVFLLIVLKRVR